MTNCSEATPHPKYVLMTADTVGGVWTYALELARSLSAFDVHVTLATMGKRCTDAQRTEAAGLDNVTLVESEYKLEWMDDCQAEVEAAGEWLLDLERGLAPDLVHLNGYVHGSLPWQSPVLCVAHSCVLSWWEAVRRTPLPGNWDWYRSEVTRGLHAVDLVVAPSHAMLDVIDRFYGPMPRRQVIYNGCNPLDFSLTDKEEIIFSAGRLWDDAKNVRSLQEVAPRLSWPVYVAGGDATAGDLSESTNVQALGRLPHSEVKQWLARAALYVLPARYEPFGLSILEAALSGCALVVGDIPSLREIWGDAATFVDPEDQSALERSISDLISDPARRSQMAVQARQRGEQFTSSRMVREYFSVYQSLIHCKQEA